MSQQGSSITNTRKRSHEDGHEIDVGNEIVKQIAYEKETLKANGPLILSNLVEIFKNFELRSRRMIKPLKS